MKLGFKPFQRHNKAKNEETIRNYVVPKRLGLLFLIVCLLLLVLLVDLFKLDVIDYKKMTSMLNSESKVVIKLNNAPRGSIYDNQGKELVSNEANQAIIYTKKRGITNDEMLKVANRLSDYIEVPTKNITERDKKDYFLASQEHNEEVLKRIPKSKLQKTENDTSKTYKLQLEYVRNDEIDYDDKTLQAVAIYKIMNNAQTMVPVFIKNRDVSDEEIARVGEHENELEGVSTSVDWSRKYTSDADKIKTILGSVSTETAGLPADKAKQYLKKGYSLNDRVGLSYLEEAYEEDLQGQRGEVAFTINNQQDIVKQKVLKEAKKGDNIKLTIDIDFQNKLNDLVKNFTQQLASSNPASEGAYVVVNNPETGAIIGLAGYSVNPKTGKITDDTLGTINKAFIPGSVVKPATITSGYQNHVISDYQVFTDTPVILGSGASRVVKSSIFNRSGSINLNPVQALTLSSNVYMMNIVFKMLGITYHPGLTMPNDISPIEKLRKTYAEYGLGASTGIDIDGETKGFINKDFYDSKGNIKPGTQGNMLDLSFGNYDTYSPLQLAQYVSTIANSGKRVAMHLVEGVYDSNSDGGLGKEIKQIEPKTLNTVDLTQKQWDILHEGLYQCVHASNGTAYSLASSTPFNLNAKTGTAETKGYNRFTKSYVDTVNLSLISYVNPKSKDQTKLAVTIVLPKLGENGHPNLDLATQVYKLYYDTFGYKTVQ